MGNSINQTSPLSYGQQALWYLNQLEPDSTAYHLGVCLELRGVVDEVVLAKAWADIGTKHPQLRACFLARKGKPVVEIATARAPLRIETGGKANLLRFWEEITRRPFALAREAPVRALLLHGENGVSHLLLCAHHIVADLWSSAIILKELAANYQARLSSNDPIAVGREDASYADFVAAENTWLRGAEGCAAWEFWWNHLKGSERTPILTDQVGSGRSGAVSIALRNGEAGLVRNFAQKRAITPYAVLLACYARLLGEETDRDELIIGTPASLRSHAKLRAAVGYLVNAVPVRCPVDDSGEASVPVIAANSRASLLRRRFPFSVLVERLGAARSPSITPMFQTMFAYQALPRANRSFLPLALGEKRVGWKFAAGVVAHTVSLPVVAAQFPIALTLGADGEEFSGQLQYDGCRVVAERATILANRFPEVVREFLSERRSKSPSIVPSPVAERLEQLFDVMAQQTPEAIALREGETTWNYAAVQAKAEAYAAGLENLLSGCRRPVGCRCLLPRKP
jgi:hypothetical protein